MVDTLSPHMHVAGSDDLDGLPIDAARMFADHKGVHKPRIEKKQRNLAQKLSFLNEFLEEGEQIQVITTAVSPTSFLEQMTTGYIFAYIKRCLLVFTDRRVIHIPTTTGYDYRQSVAQIRYGDLDSIVQKGNRLKITYKTGSKDLFLYVRRSERKNIRALLESVNLQGSTSDAGTRVHLCPKCTSELQADVYECPRCQLEFKNRERALQLSIWLPGGGYFYTRHPVLGILDAFFELFLLAAIVSSLVIETNYVIAGVFAVLLIIEKMITVYHANHFVKEYLTIDAPPTRSRPVITFLKWVGLAILLMFIALGFLGILSDTGVVPSSRVLGPDEIPAGHYELLVAEQVIFDEEVIEFFFSEGMLSIREGGSILTDQRVIAYVEEDEQVSVYYIWNEEIRSIELTTQGDALNFSVYVVGSDEEDDWLELWLPHEYGDAERFAAAVEAKIVN